jgi:protoporphyrin/coproporphyrin ferrochelatase
MKYIGTENFDHEQQPRVGILLTNLGTPEAPQKRELRAYLKEFLSDPRVVEVPRLLWWFILNGVILNIRPARSAESYRSVWTEQGSPLMIHTRNQARALQEAMAEQFGDRVIVDFAMRYGDPAIAGVVQGMLGRGVRKLLVLPLYPQYSGATTASTFDALAADFTRRRWIPELRFVTHYHDHDAYITALADSIRRHQTRHGSADKLLFSYHGEPRSYLDKGDPYHCHCHKTTRLVAEALGLEKSQYLTTFQSRFGREEWLQPYTDETLKALPGQGVKSVQVICPGFSCDCLETLEEIGVENRGYFMASGGERFEYIPCLNSHPGHIAALATLAGEHISGWIETDGN